VDHRAPGEKQNSKFEAPTQRSTCVVGRSTTAPKGFDLTSPVNLPSREQVALAKAEDAKPVEAKPTRPGQRPQRPKTRRLFRRRETEARDAQRGSRAGIRHVRRRRGHIRRRHLAWVSAAGALALAALFEARVSASGPWVRTGGLRTFRLVWGRHVAKVRRVFAMSGSSRRSRCSLSVANNFRRAQRNRLGAAPICVRALVSLGPLCALLVAGTSYALRGERLTSTIARRASLSRAGTPALAPAGVSFRRKVKRLAPSRTR